MSLSRSARAPQRLGVLAMALALALAAFLGGAMGLVWQSSDLADEGQEEGIVTAETPAEG